MSGASLSKTMRSSILITFILSIGIGVAFPFRPANLLDGAIPSISKIDVSLHCLSNESIEGARRSGSINSLAAACDHELRTVLDSDFGDVDDEVIRIVLATIVAANFANYGVSSAISFDGIRQSKDLNCGNTILLAGYLFGTLESSKIRPIGFDGGDVGNHSQLLYLGEHETILLDPTTGLVAQTDFNDLLRGVPVSENKIRSFAIKDKTIETFRQKVYLAVRDGEYEPSDFMYMHKTLAELATEGMLSRYFSPGAINAAAGR
ncbi:hypothetical protein JQ615_34535 [Bradyrhizobium jicamae]|uniref:Protein SirB1 N-terminal domain-containing protein n=1 Tax=Bradyrhizobium jicamae TaxID=280332 RepID=A0ABS5FUJ3_9BRAD|nr:hypothetical protein [Bradyrhizobium jicamae]MBR0800497.1 hypothetical protein [Bradyrhizobium jicamae]